MKATLIYVTVELF